MWKLDFGFYKILLKRGLTHANANPASSPSKEEKILLEENGVFVSNIRFIDNKQTYAMSGVTSVNQFIEQPSRKWEVAMMSLACICFYNP